MTNKLPSKRRNAFTLIEVLISIALLGIVIVALFSTVSMMKDSNEHLHSYLQKAKKVTKATKVLYLDIISSDGNISIQKDEFTRLCMEQTRNSLYALSLAKVCWVILKDKHTLARIEGNNYQLPTRFQDRVEGNPVMQNVELFDVYHQKDKVLVFLKQKGQEPITFMVQGVTKPKIKIPVQQTNTNRPPNNGRQPNNTNPNARPRQPLNPRTQIGRVPTLQNNPLNSGRPINAIPINMPTQLQ